MLSALILVGFFGLCLAAHELARRHRVFAWSFWGIVPVALTPLWILHHRDTDWFTWVKLYSVVIGVTWFNVLRYTSLGQKRWALRVVWFVLAANILEAVIKDATGYSASDGLTAAAHVMNALAGALLIATLDGWDSIRIDTGPLPDLRWDRMTIGWIVGYTVWNGIFTYLTFTDALFHIPLLLAPVVATARAPQRWLFARGTTLGVYIFAWFAFTPFFLEWGNTQSWRIPSAQVALAAIPLAFMIAYTLWHFIPRRRADAQEAHGARVASSQAPPRAAAGAQRF